MRRVNWRLAGRLALALTLGLLAGAMIQAGRTETGVLLAAASGSLLIAIHLE